MSLVPAAIRTLPLGMLATLMAIVLFGLATLYSAAGGSISPWASNQGLRFVLLSGLMFALSRISVARWMDIAYPLYGVTLVLLLIVELFGKIGMGAQRWIDLGFIRLQPSEFMKIAVVLSLAKFFHRLPAIYVSTPSVLVAPIALFAVPAALVMLQPDLGTAMMISMASVLVIFLAGVGLRWFLTAGAALLAALPVAWSMLHDYQKNRVLVFMDPEGDPLGTGYHITQSKIAIGSGGLFGKGFLDGTQSHLAYLPEAHTDFIFATMAEEWGVMGGLFVVLTYGYLIRWGWRLGVAGDTIFTRLTACGLAFTIFLYVSINLAMVMGLAPVVGIPLPLMSYGGSAMMTVLILLGILMAIHRENVGGSRLNGTGSFAV
ncbi:MULTISPECIES: rod shape-determining protein RodA [Sphingobium]|uniref:Peptidoglycan glycosyltransferase MrdB n=1 Tax=Sphingobium limneticum TaxID=1007511 RepID=A0A5J5I2R8_9SPHN|nr:MULTISPECIES: rod shape-determining protein RodA [Sphingobium]KAA9011883.1 rod shape-determining protein RodA [Sphingobium limneticum]KAA9017382.1 rod shape-determining protein RodA [Sphingobium limneticum]KAA9029206.1 rod shape-determining protein RodA [Sphingobium limneticum]